MSEFLKQIRLLYVEDDEVHKNELASFLKRRVGKLYLASNGEEGLEKFRTLSPDAILCDLRMPKMDGIEMSLKIRELNRNVPIIILTALSDKNTILQSVDLNIINYLVKPVDVKKLVVVLEDMSISLNELGVLNADVTYDKERINDLKNELTKYIKAETGKGPNEVRLKTSEGKLEINIYGALTTYEKSLLIHDRNLNLVNYNRDVFYQDRMEVIIKMIYTLLMKKVKVVKLKTYSELDESVLIFEVI